MHVPRETSSGQHLADTHTILTTTTATESLVVTTHTISCLTNTSQDAMLTRMLEPSARARRECILHVHAHTDACTHSISSSGIILCVQLLIQLESLGISRCCTHACSCSEVMFCVLRYALLIIKTRAIHSYLTPVYSSSTVLCCVVVNTIAVSRPDKVERVKDILHRMARQGQLRGKVSHIDMVMCWCCLVSFSVG